MGKIKGNNNIRIAFTINSKLRIAISHNRSDFSILIYSVSQLNSGDDLKSTTSNYRLTSKEIVNFIIIVPIILTVNLG